MTNKYTGEVPLKVGEKQGTLVYNWGAIGTVEAEFTKEQLENLPNLKPDQLARIAEIGFSEKSPEIKADDFNNAKPAPAVFVVAKAIDQALLYAYHGDDQATAILKRIEKAEKEIEESEAAADEAKKKAKAK